MRNCTVQCPNMIMQCQLYTEIRSPPPYEAYIKECYLCEIISPSIVADYTFKDRFIHIYVVIILIPVVLPSFLKHKCAVEHFLVSALPSM
jgi:hypothetical protein